MDVFSVFQNTNTSDKMIIKHLLWEELDGPVSDMTFAQ